MPNVKMKNWKELINWIASTHFSKWNQIEFESMSCKIVALTS